MAVLIFVFITGFIDFIVSPSLEVCGDMLDRILHHLESHKDGVIAEDSSGKFNSVFSL